MHELAPSCVGTTPAHGVKLSERRRRGSWSRQGGDAADGITRMVKICPEKDAHQTSADARQVSPLQPSARNRRRGRCWRWASAASYEVAFADGGVDCGHGEQHRSDAGQAKGSNSWNAEVKEDGFRIGFLVH